MDILDSICSIALDSWNGRGFSGDIFLWDDGTFQHLNQIQVQKVTNSYMTRVFKGPNKTPFHGSQRDQEKKIQLSSNSQMVIQHFSSWFTRMRVDMFIFV